jgi:dTDP-4-amino-4,6-dideoxygalactose transaminase
MAFRLQRTIPPAAAPLTISAILNGLRGGLTGLDTSIRRQSEIGTYFGSRYAFLTSSGKAALTLILRALKNLQPERDEVFLPAFNCYSVPSAVVRADLKIRLADMAADRLDFDCRQLQSCLGRSSPLAVVATHFFGKSAAVDFVSRHAGRAGAFVVEDAAQAMGIRHMDRWVGTQGDVGFFSLGRGKVLSAIEGGIILTSREDIGRALAKQVRHLNPYQPFEKAGLLVTAAALNLLVQPALFWLPKALPFLKLGETLFDPGFKLRRLSSFQSGLLHGWQATLNLWQKRRAAHCRHWHNWIGRHFPGLALAGIGKGNNPSLLRYPLRIDDQMQRQALLRRSDRHGTGIMPTYPEAIHRIPALRKHFQGQAFPEADRWARQLVTLPTHPLLSVRDRQKIENDLRSILGYKRFQNPI